MRFPSINKQPERAVNVPKLEGGINMRDSVTMVQDNQLTEAKNIWFKDNILKTRPGISTIGTMEGDYNPPSHINYRKSVRIENIKISRNGAVYKLISQKNNYYGSATGEAPYYYRLSEINFFLVNEDENIKLPALNAACENNYFITQWKNNIYFFAENAIYKLSMDSEEWEEIPDNPTLDENNRIYIPKVIINCKTDGGWESKAAEYAQTGYGTMFEGYNLLSSYYKMIYSTVNKELYTVETADYYPAMIYKLLNGLTREDISKKIVATHTDFNGTYKHEITITDDLFPESENEYTFLMERTKAGDGLRMIAEKGRICFTSAENGAFPNLKDSFSSSGIVAYAGSALDVDYENNIQLISDMNYIENNLEIIAPSHNKNQSLEKIFLMTQNMWFGGDAAGISGGSRLFLGGNIKKEEQSLILWSGLNNPLYFSENCYAYIGNDTQAVTAFGRQGDSLIIFKENETFYTQYVKADSISADDLINQNVVDYTAASVYFPIVQLHSAIGCDCPQSIQLCRNYLVWAASDGNVYTLRNENQYSERNIYKLSDMIKRKLKEFTAEELKNATSADFEGHYFLSVGNKILIMNYESYGYVYVSSYNKTDDAQARVPWWIWELPHTRVNIDTDIMPAFLSDNEEGEIWGWPDSIKHMKFNEENTADENFSGNTEKINTVLITKIFDFGAPHHNKNVPLINIAFGNTGGSEIKVTFVTDTVSEEGETVILTEGEREEYSPDFVRNKQFRPCARLINRIGIRLKSEGKIAVDSISLNYRILGGSR